jgi:hypothetical protein
LAASSFVKEVAHRRFRWIEQSNDDPVFRVLVNRPDKKMGVVFFDHVALKALAERLLPAFPVLLSPSSIRLSHFPIRTTHRMAVAFGIGTFKFVFKFKRYFFERLSRRFLE